MQRLFPAVGGRVEPLSIYDDLELPEGRDGRPYTALNMVSTVDGKTTLDENRIREPIGSRLDRALMGRLRQAFDAVIRGAETVRADPHYPGVPPELEHRRIARGLARQPLAVVITASGDLPLDSPYFQGAPRRPLVIAASTVPLDKLAALRKAADVHVVSGPRVDIPSAFRLLYETYGVRRLLSEGGPRFNQDCLAAGLLDEIFWTLTPRIAGGSRDLTMVEGPGVLAPMPRLALVSAYCHEHELFLRYRRAD
ncbi:MAG: RibD family protein [Firmicutes bacterium]|nr:RibD family protein [Bacillota bacterium]